MLTTTCPSCKALFRLADDMAGKRVKCQKCQHVFVVAGSDKGAPDEETTAVKREPKAPAPPPPAEDADEEREAAAEDDERVTRRRKKPPMSKKRYEDDDVDEDEVPDDDDEPRRRGRKKRRSASGSSNTHLGIILAIGGGLVACIICGGAGTLFYMLVNRNAPVRDGPILVAKDKKNKKGPERQPGGGNVQKPAAIDVVLAANGTFRHDANLAANDALNIDGTPHKLYRVRLEANRTYEIDMMSNQIDPILIIVDENDAEVAWDDDGGQDFNSRIIFTPTRTAFYFIEATHCPPDINPARAAFGPYTLMVRRR